MPFLTFSHFYYFVCIRGVWKSEIPVFCFLGRCSRAIYPCCSNTSTISFWNAGSFSLSIINFWVNMIVAFLFALLSVLYSMHMVYKIQENPLRDKAIFSEFLRFPIFSNWFTNILEIFCLCVFKEASRNTKIKYCTGMCLCTNVFFL